MKTMKFLTIVILSIFLSTTVTSCKGEDGRDGVDGVDGEQGPPGEDGNANVLTIRFQSPQWADYPSPYLDFLYLDVPQITYDDANHSAILHYISFQNDHYTLLPVDDFYLNGVGPGFSIHDEPTYQSTQIRFTKNTPFDPIPDPTPSVDFLKIIIIRPSDIMDVVGNSSESGRSIDPKQRILNELENAGVDVRDYYAVCEYYGINPE